MVSDYRLADCRLGGPRRGESSGRRVESQVARSPSQSCAAQRLAPLLDAPSESASSQSPGKLIRVPLTPPPRALLTSPSAHLSRARQRPCNAHPPRPIRDNPNSLDNPPRGSSLGRHCAALFEPVGTSHRLPAPPARRSGLDAGNPPRPARRAFTASFPVSLAPRALDTHTHLHSETTKKN